MNRARVVGLMTVAVFITLGGLMTAIFDGFPPWPVMLWFTLSHVFFCLVILSVRPFKGPYTTPMIEPTIKDWD